MKKIMIFFISFITILSLVGCSKKTTKEVTNTNRETVEILESDLEAQICNIAEFLDSATFTVLNYTSTDSEEASSLGSGVIYKRVINDNNTYTYYLVTNRHVIEDGEKFKVYSSGATITADRLGYSSTYDVGVLTFTSYEKYNVVPFANIEDVKQGQMCFAMGTPLYLKYANTFTHGNVSAIRTDRIQHTADINAGNSGGPLVNINGELIGINVSKISTNRTDQADIDGMCFAIRIDRVTEAINEIENANNAVVNPLLGMTVTDVSNVRTFNYDTFADYWEELKNEFVAYYKLIYPSYDDEYLAQLFNDTYGSSKNEYEESYIDLHAFNLYIADGITKGMIIRNIVSNSVCEVAGLKIGDVITKINNVTVETQTDFTKEYYKHGIGDTFTLTINRQGENKTISVTL